MIRSMFTRCVLLGLVAIWPGLIGCEEEPDAASVVVINSWLQAGLGPADFKALDEKALGKDAMCKQSTLSGVETTICQYPDAKAAVAARKAGFAHVGEVTGVALPVGNLLLLVADREKADPSGRKINEIVKIFRDKAPKPAEAATEAEKAAESDDKAAAESNDKKAKKGK